MHTHTHTQVTPHSPEVAIEGAVIFEPYSHSHVVAVFVGSVRWEVTQERVLLVLRQHQKKIMSKYSPIDEL